MIVSAVDEEANKALGRLLRLASTSRIIDYGVLLAAASRNSSTAYTLQNDLRNRTNQLIAALGLTTDGFARVLRAHQAGPSANQRLSAPLSGHVKYDPPEDYELDSILLRRAFDGFARVQLSSQDGGYSKDCKVWKIEAYTDTGRCQPFVAKAARRADLQSEFETYCAFVRDFVPFPFRAPVLENRFVKGSSRAVLVSAFISRSQRLESYLAAATNPELVIVSLFDGALGTWRRNSEKQRLSLGRFYVQQYKALADSGMPREEREKKALLPDPSSLDTAHKNALKMNKKLPAPSEVWHKLENLAEGDHFFCLIHGDLNIRNVFVRWNTIDTILIDFSHSGVKESMARDPAKLETSIALTARDTKNKLLSMAALRNLYGTRLLPPRDFEEGDGRIEAIRQIRRHVGGEGVSSEEYELLTLCHFLRFACEPANNQRNSPPMEKRRALSYMVACGLLENL
ncbi:MAG: hypothetical protein WB919_22175 [Candidatus Sulfotelmatobacter sp.]